MSQYSWVISTCSHFGKNTHNEGKQVPECFLHNKRKGSDHQRMGNRHKRLCFPTGMVPVRRSFTFSTDTTTGGTVDHITSPLTISTNPPPCWLLSSLSNTQDGYALCVLCLCALLECTNCKSLWIRASAKLLKCKTLKFFVHEIYELIFASVRLTILMWPAAMIWVEPEQVSRWGLVT